MNLQLMKILSRLLETEAGRDEDRKLPVLPWVRILLAVLTIFLCALSRNAVFTYGVLAVELLHLSLLTTGQVEITGAFGALHFPDLFVLVLDQTVRFLVLLGRYSNEIFEAVTLRMVGGLQERISKEDEGRRLSHHARQHNFGGILGTTFLRARRMSAASYEAMECRGFDGTYRTYRKRTFHWYDGAYLGIGAVLIILFVFCERAMGK